MAVVIRTTKEEWGLARKQGKFLRVVTTNTARQVLAREQTRGTFPRDPKLFTTWVDRHPNKPEQQVKFGGTISYIRREPMAEVYEYIIRELARRSPSGPGPKRGRQAFRRRHYSDSHVVLVAGKDGILKADLDLNSSTGAQHKTFVPGGQGPKKVWFMNIQPYARRIERGARGAKIQSYGTTATRGKHKGTLRYKTRFWTDQAPSGVYRLVALSAARRYRGVAQIKFAYRQMKQLGYNVRITGDMNTKDRSSHFSQVYPTIIVRPDKGAIL